MKLKTRNKRNKKKRIGRLKFIKEISNKLRKKVNKRKLNY